MNDKLPSPNQATDSSDREAESLQAQPIVVDAKPDDERIANADESVERAGW